MYRRIIVVAFVASCGGGEVVPLAAVERDAGPSAPKRDAGAHPDGGEAIDAAFDGGAFQNLRCDLEFSPSHFRIIEGTRSVRRSVELRSHSDVPCDVTFRGILDPLPSDFRLEARDAKLLTFAFPRLMHVPCLEEALLLEALVDGEARAAHYMTWTRADPTLLVVPNHLDYGRHEPGTQHERDITIYNPNGSPTDVRVTPVVGDAFVVIAPSDVTLAPGQTTTLTVRATAPDEGVADGRLELIHTSTICAERTTRTSQATMRIRAEP